MNKNYINLNDDLDNNKFIGSYGGAYSMYRCIAEVRNNKNILEDSFEAFIGALYLDTNDIYFVKDFLIKVYEKYVDFAEIILNDTNYKDQLLRYFQNSFPTLEEV